MTMTDEQTDIYPIEHGIPLPDPVKTERKIGVTHYPWREMEVGDSFLVPYDGEPGTAVQNRVNATATHYRKRYAITQRHTTRQTPDGVRCWRTR